MEKSNKLDARPALVISALKKAAEKIGADILIEPEWQSVGQITYKSGIRRYFRMTTLDLNTAGSTAIACDKDYTKFFLQSMGYKVPIGKTFFRKDFAKLLKVSGREIDDAYNYAKSLGFPVFVKPNTLSCGVAVSKVRTKSELYAAARAALKQDRVMLIEECVSGSDYRIVVFDGQIIAAYQRIALNIVGDGRSTVGQLLDIKEETLSSRGRKVTIDRTDFRLLGNLKRQKFDLQSFLPKGQTIQLLDNANLTSGGDTIDVSKSIHQGFGELAIKVARDMGLRLAGVDLMINGDIAATPDSVFYWIIEVNSAPGLDHYASMGQEQKTIAENLYSKILNGMETV